MGLMFDTVINFLEKDDWRYHQVEDESVLKMIVSGENGEFVCYAEIEEQEEEDHGWFLFYSCCPVKVPDDKKTVIAEFITRANYGLKIGNFELDFRDGEVRYKTGIRIREDELTHYIIKNLIYPNLAMMDRYLPGIMRVMYGDVPPEEAIFEIEN
jgi:hypothetical protein